MFGWNLLLSVNDGSVHETKDLGDDLKKHLGLCDGRVHHEHISKGRKTDNASRTLSGSVDILSTTVKQLSSCSNHDAESREKQMNEISCSATIQAAKNKRFVYSAILHYTGANSNCSGIGRPTAQKVLLEFEHESFYIYQSLQIGCYYITEHKNEGCFCKHKDSDNLSSIKLRVSSKLHFWSLSFAHDVPLGSNLRNHPSSSDTCADSNNVSSKDPNEVHFHMSNGDYLETYSDVSLSLPANGIGILKVNINELDEGMIKSAVTHRGIPEVYACARSVSSAPPFVPNNNFLLPEGNLLSLRGHVVAAHDIGANLNCQNLGDSPQSRRFSGTSSSCVHVLVEQQIVKIFGSADEQFFPPGFGPGVDATFHRVLELREQDRWMLTPVSFLVINSLRLADKPFSERSSSLVLEMNGGASHETLSLGLISELAQHPDCKLMRIRCRVVAVNILVFETCRNNVNLQQKFCSRQPQVGIPIAGFVLDDGSSPCCCWTNAERATTFLRLHDELPKKASKSNDRRLNKRVEMENNSCHAIKYRLGRILQKHARITVKNFGSLLDSSHQELAVSVSSGNTQSVR